MLGNANIENVKVVQFAPETWGEIDRFNVFYRTTYRFDVRTEFARVGVAGQFRKTHRLLALAQRLAPNLQDEAEEAENKGF